LKQTTFSWNDAVAQSEKELELENPSFLSLLTENNFKATELKVILFLKKKKTKERKQTNIYQQK